LAQLGKRKERKFRMKHKIIVKLGKINADNNVDNVADYIATNYSILMSQIWGNIIDEKMFVMPNIDKLLELIKICVDNNVQFKYLGAWQD
jgi:hypothetical protein